MTKLALAAILFAVFQGICSQATSTDSSTAASTSAASTSDSTTAPASTSASASSSDSTSSSGATGSIPNVTEASTTRASTRAPWPKPNCGSTTLSNGLRDIFLNLHNSLRGSLARGQDQRSAGWDIAPPAALMYRMKYSCEAESYAIEYVSSCQTRELPAYTHPGYKVNSYVFRNTAFNERQVARNVLVFWWGQLAWYGMRSNMMFYGTELSRGTRNVLSWSKMAWWNNRYLGCAIKRCAGFYYTACMYRPGGNNVGQYVYKVGAVCSECPRGQCDRLALCRW